MRQKNKRNNRSKSRSRTSKNNKGKALTKKFSTRQKIVIIVVLVIVLFLVGRWIKSCQDDRVIMIPKGCGTYATREWDLNYYGCADFSNQHKVEERWKKYGTEDKKGFQKLYGRYLIACTDTFGEVGDKIDFYMSDGTVLKCIIYDNKSREKTFYDNKPANKWGHDEGRVVLEFVGSAKLGTSPYKKLGLRYEHTVKAVRCNENILEK